MKARLFWAGAAAALVALAIGCGGSPTSATQNGNFRVMLTDTPFSDAKAVLVTFSDVSMHASGGGWTTVPFSGGGSSRTCDLKQLQNHAQDVLGVGTLPAGHYTQVRVTVTRAALYFDTSAPAPACAPSIAAPSGRSVTLNVPSGQIILNREFDVVATNTGTMVLDFNGDQSINQLGNGLYQIAPVIAVVSVQ
jgi:hypothetical protein